jgi:putative transposase
MPARLQRAHTDVWQQLKQYCRWPEQRRYELLRPIVLFGDLSTERAQQTEANERTLRRQADQFDREGMRSLSRPTQAQLQDRHRSLPPPVRQCIVDLKADYADFSLREIAQICYIRFARRPSHHTIKQVLADGPAPSRKQRRFPLYAEIPDPFQRRSAIVTLHAEGWTAATIADYLSVARSTVYEALKRFRDEGYRGLDDKSRANTRPVRTVDVATKNAIRKLQENPELGAFRIYAALRQMSISVSRATCGRILAENRQLYGLGKPPKAAKEPKEHPYKAQYRHHIWSVDVRYIEHHQIPEVKGSFYVISVLDNFSRAILSSDVFQRQDLTAYLVVLYAAVQQHGCPAILLSDSGAIFRAKQAQAIYAALEIEKQQIHKKQAWENLIETQFNLQRRLADYHFAQVTSWQGAKDVHARWMNEHNYQAHWAHRARADGRLSPAEVLGWVRGRLWEPQRLHRVFFSHRFGRWLDRLGCVRFRHWRLYGELGLARQRATLWLYNETLTVEFANTPLSQFRVSYQPDKKHLRQITEPHHFETQYRSPQRELWDSGTVEWHLVRRLPEYTVRQHRATTTRSWIQPVLLAPVLQAGGA